MLFGRRDPSASPIESCSIEKQLPRRGSFSVLMRPIIQHAAFAVRFVDVHHGLEDDLLVLPIAPSAVSSSLERRL